MNGIDKMIEISLATDDDFLKVKETLTRIGIASMKENSVALSRSKPTNIPPTMVAAALETPGITEML